MSSIVFVKLIPVFAIIAIGWGAAQTKALRGDAAVQTMSYLAFFLFIPAMLFRTTARIDLGGLPWGTLAAYFGPVVTLLLLVYGWHRWHADRKPAEPAVSTEPAEQTVPTVPAEPAMPGVRALSTTFGNAVQLGLPVVAALFGSVGLSVHVAIISMHALTLMTTATILTELDLSRATARTNGGRPRIAATVAVTAKRAVIHPIVLPVLLGLTWNLAGPSLPGAVDDVLATLSAGVSPVCLMTIGMSLAHYGVAGSLRGATMLAVGKLLVQPAVILGVAHWGVGLHGTTLATVVLFAALPIGSNALIFAQRYHTREAEVTAGIMVSTLGFAVTAPLWLLVLSALV